MLNSDYEIVLFIKNFAESELDVIERSDEEYKEMSVLYVLQASKQLIDNEIRVNILTGLEDFSTSTYNRYVKLIEYCNKLLEMKND